MSVLARRLATLVSWIGHPLVFVTSSVSIALLTQLAARAALPVLAALFVAVIAPMALLLFFGVRSGRWKDADVSLREERKRFYSIAIPLSALGLAVMWLTNAPRYILRGGMVTLLLLIVAGLVNQRFKISLHTLFASYCTTILFRVNLVGGLAGLALAALVFWSRLFLGRHTFAETVAGLVLGLAGGFAAAWLSI